ncbi:DeoR/GlpR family DNA-binding transcription regulator [Nakamurella sp.]|uniref:DeoR/GlpR family DNA-binding transcription regulator n=1 Tax=Nakamurella sp. TaxID=1869182 RepID=UPI003B3BB71D
MTQSARGDEAWQARTARQRQRQQEIAELVTAEGTVRIEDLIERFGVSAMTVHRDLDQLEAQGLLRKTRGQVTALGSSLTESGMAFRSTRNLAEKVALAHAALEFVESGQSIVLDDSTTAVQLARLLPRRAPLGVITNSAAVAAELAREPQISLTVVGGLYHSWCDAYQGQTTVDAIANIRADTFVMSAAAITDDIAFFQNLDTIAVKRAMFTSSARRLLLADHTKFGQRALHALLPLAEFDAVIVDTGTGADQIERMRRAGITVVVAPVDPPA